MRAIQLVRAGIAYPGLVKGGNLQPKVNVVKKRSIMLREASREQEKKEIRALFRSGDTLYYSDIVERSGIGLRTVVEICDELKADGEIAIGESI